MKAYPKKTRFVIWGYGVTGRALVDVLHSRDYPISVIEDSPEAHISESTEKIAELTRSGVRFKFGGISNMAEYLRSEADVLAPSPGIAVPEEIVEACEEAKVQIAGEIEIAQRLVQGQLIAVTGTDGKTTTATLIHHILNSAGLTAHLAGNIGTPFITLAGHTRHDHWLVVEVSSYQLESVRLFRPFISVLLNIAEDHLARHGDMRTYIRTKGRIFERQRENDYAVLNFDDPTCLQAHAVLRVPIHGFSLAGPLPGGAWRENSGLMVDTKKGPRKVMDTSELQLPGEHSQLNALASILTCKLAGCPIDKIGPAIAEFTGLPHRIETIAKAGKVLWVNDSKATNVHSTISAVKSFDKPIILLLGGFDKGLDITELVPHIQRQARHVILMGETRNRFKKDIREAGYTDLTLRKTLPEACAFALTIAKPGDVVLLSPASSSFDQYKNFVERGEAFRRWVQKRIVDGDR